MKKVLFFMIYWIKELIEMGDKMQSIGNVIGGSTEKGISIRLKSDAKVNIGDIISCKNSEATFYLKITNLYISSSVPNQFIEEISGKKLEREENYHFFDKEERFYKIAETKILKIKNNDKLKPPKDVPSYFSEVYLANPKEFEFLNEGGEIEIGYLKNEASSESLKIKLPANNLISHHMLIVAATGKGKSNFAKVFLKGIMSCDKYSAIVFDPHNEYYGGESIKGLRDLPNTNNKVIYFTPLTENLPAGAEKLEICVSDLEPEDFFGMVDLTSAQQEAIALIYKTYGKNWIKGLFEQNIDEQQKTFKDKIQNVTFATLKRKIGKMLDISENMEEGIIFKMPSNEESKSKTIYDKIKEELKNNKIIIIDTSMVGGDAEKIITSSIVNKVYNLYRYNKQKKPKEFNIYPEVLILFEEAPRVLGSEVLSKGTNVFEKIAREGRKFKVGLCAITQMPSLLPKEILSQMNTKVILGIPSPEDRMAIINSSSQNISDESLEIQMLEIGEALITSPFVKFPLPVNIYDFNQIVRECNKDKKKENPVNPGV